jgi:hypothetical protein
MLDLQEIGGWYKWHVEYLEFSHPAVLGRVQQESHRWTAIYVLELVVALEAAVLVEVSRDLPAVVAVEVVVADRAEQLLAYTCQLRSFLVLHIQLLLVPVVPVVPVEQVVQQVLLALQVLLVATVALQVLALS